MNAATPTFNSSWQPTNPLLLWWLTARGLIAASLLANMTGCC